MDISNLSVIAAGLVIYNKKIMKETSFCLYCQQTCESFMFRAAPTRSNRMSMLRYDKMNLVEGYLYDYFDYAEKYLYHILDICAEVIEVMNVTLGKFFSVRLTEDAFQVVDYQQKEVFDFSLVALEES